MRLAHLILVHNDPNQLERLIQRLTYTDTDIYIHLDAKTDIKYFAYLEAIKDVFLIPGRTAITWGNYSMVTATVNSFEYILNTGINYSHINLLSGHDYPLKSAAEIQSFLFKNADKTFMRYKSIFDDWQESANRFNLYSLGDYDFHLKYTLQWVLNRFLPKKKLPNNLKAYGFSQWTTITPVCARYVIDYLKENPSVKQFFRLTWGVDELVFQTILVNSYLKDTIVNDHLRYIKFVKAASRPNTLTIADAKTLLDSGKFYARKFHADVDSEILDYLDSHC